MKFRSHVFADVSGSLAGSTFAKNKGGLYTRARVAPVNPNTAAQVLVRGNLATLSALWASLLDDAQRTAWAAYAAATPLSNAFGDPLVLSGQQMFLKVNALAALTDLGVLDDAPTTPGLADLGGVTLTVTASSGNVRVDVTGDPQWIADDDGRLVVFQGPPQKPTINFFKGPFRFAFHAAGNTTTPPTFVSHAGIFPVEVDQADFVRIVAIDAEGRPSPQAILRTIVV